MIRETNATEMKHQCVISHLLTFFVMISWPCISKSVTRKSLLYLLKFLLWI